LAIASVSDLSLGVFRNIDFPHLSSSDFAQRGYHLFIVGFDKRARAAQKVFCPTSRYDNKLKPIRNTSETIFHCDTSHALPSLLIINNLDFYPKESQGKREETSFSVNTSLRKRRSKKLSGQMKKVGN